MSFTTDLYNSIAEDIHKGTAGNALYATRLLTYPNGVRIVYAINIISNMRSAYFVVGEGASKKAFPSWKGINIELVKFPIYQIDQNCVGLTQLPQSADYIFELVIEDIRMHLEAIESSDFALRSVISILAKWREFFQTDRDLLLSEIKQQGLYGELLFLEEVISKLNVSMVNSWAGCSEETHDFYLSSNAIEIKTSSKQAPYTAHISSEYQLDTHDVPGKLFLRYYALRRSHSGGERLLDIITRIRATLSEHSTLLLRFNEKLQKYGYYDEVADLYEIGYYLRDTYTFQVVDGFPRIIKSDLISGVSDLEYAISITQCIPFAIDAECLLNELKGV